MDETLKKKFNEHMKLRMRLKKHGNMDRVDKAGRKNLNRTPEEKKELRKKYYNDVLKPRIQAKRAKEQAQKPPKVAKTDTEKKESNRKYYINVVKPKLEAGKLLKTLEKERDRLKKLLEKREGS
jgi:hypothetical protein